MKIYLQCEVDAYGGRNQYTIEIQKMKIDPADQFVVGTKTCRLQVRLTQGHYNYFHDYENNEWIETRSNVTRIRFGILPFSYDEYSMQLFQMNEETGTTLTNKIRINKRFIEQSCMMHHNPKHLDIDKWENFDWYVRMEGKDFICENKPVKKLNPYFQPAKVEQEDENKQSSEPMTIESLLRLPDKWTYYDVLGISPLESTPKDITRAYKSKALEWHPDKLPECIKKYPNITAKIMTHLIKLINIAYAILSDSGIKKLYDMNLGANQPIHHMDWNLDGLDSKFQNPYIVY